MKNLGLNQFGVLLYMIMDKEEIMEFVRFHEDKANYYIEIYNEMLEEETTIGFKYIKTSEDN